LNGIGLSIVRDLRRDAHGKLLHQSSRFYTQASTGDLMSRLLSDVELIQSAFGNRITDLVQGALTIVLVLLYVFSLNARLALVVFLLAPVVLLPIVEVTRRLRRTTFSSRERIGEMGALLGETLRGHRVIKTYGMERFEAERFALANDRYFRVTRRTIRIQALNSPMMEILAGLGLAALFIYAAGLIGARQMTVGSLLSFLAALLMLYKPLKDVTKVNMAVQLALSSARRLFELMDWENEIVDAPDARELPPFSEAIRYENVSFRYGEAPVLEGINLTIHRGETVAIVGPSGAGKTTLANLVPRLYDPTAGRVTIDGHDLRTVTLASLRRQIGLVTQDTILFDSSARDNIAYGQAAAPEERIRAAARAAHADEFLERLPEGYETRIGEDAARLSGGQKQRLAMARALYKNAPVLILDEATSQLDSESEALVASALRNLMRGRTTLVIAHRLATVRRADRIVVLDRGRLVEEGSHAELLTRNGLYRRLHDMQYFTERDTPASLPASTV
jgi:subfamily B ATP-binding cassette protein MsbA